MIELTDSVITIRPFTLDNAQEQLDGEDEEEVKWLSGKKGTLEGVRKWIKKNHEYWINDGPVFNFAIFDSKNKLVGMVEANTDHLTVEGIDAGDANISYGLNPEGRGKGYATRAVNLILEFLKRKNLRRAIIRIDPDNVSSLKIPKRCGFTQEKVIVTKDGGKLVINTKNISK